MSMKINSLQVETLKGKYGRYGLKENGKMAVQNLRGLPFDNMGTFTADEAQAFSAENSAAASILLVDDEKQDAPQGTPATDNPRLYTVEDFKREKIAVTFANDDEQKRFLLECEKTGLMWNSGKKATEYMIPDDEPQIRFNYLGCGNLSHGKIECAKTDGCKVVPFSSFDFAQPTPLYTVTITEGTTLKEFKAILAEVFRLRNERRKKETPDPLAEEDRPAKVGEWVRIVNPICPEGYAAGDIKQVKRLCACGCGRPFITLEENKGGMLCHGEYRVLPNFHP